MALALGESLPMIGRLQGHREFETTTRNAHFSRDSMHDVVTQVAESIAEDIL